MSVPAAVRLAFLAAIALLLSACAGIKYEQDFRPGTTFGTYQSFGWRETTSEVEGTDQTRLQRIARAQLEQQGYRFDPENPDLLIDLNALTRVATGRGTGVGLSIGLPIGRHGAIGVGGSKALNNQRLEGVIVADFTERASNTLIWRGSASPIPLSTFDLSAEDRLAQVLRQLFTQFPPN